MAVIVVGVLAVLHPDRLTDQLNLFTSPSAVDIIYASVVAMLAYAGIEAASDMAPDIDVHPRDLKRVVPIGASRCPSSMRGWRQCADGGACRRRPAWVPHGARGPFCRGAGAGSGLGLPSDRHCRCDALGCRPGCDAGPLLGRYDVDARGLPPHLHAGDQPPDPELARQAQHPPRHATGGDRDLGPDRDRPGGADQRQAPCRDLRLRRDPCDHDRPALDSAPAYAPPIASAPTGCR